VALKILLADDSMTAQNMGKKILADAGYEVTTVSNGAAAVKKIAELHPDIILLDVYMPGYTGLEVCAKTKSAAGTASVPVLLTVGKMEPFRAEEGIKVKADGVIIKPFEATDLVTVVKKLAERLETPAPPAEPEPLVTERPHHEFDDPSYHEWKTTTAEYHIPKEVVEAAKARYEHHEAAAPVPAMTVEPAEPVHQTAAAPPTAAFEETIKLAAPIMAAAPAVAAAAAPALAMEETIKLSAPIVPPPSAMEETIKLSAPIVAPPAPVAEVVPAEIVEAAPAHFEEIVEPAPAHTVEPAEIVEPAPVIAEADSAPAFSVEPGPPELVAAPDEALVEAAAPAVVPVESAAPAMEPAPLQTAAPAMPEPQAEPELQTFDLKVEPGPVEAPPEIEFTAVAPAEVTASAAPGFEPTTLQEEVEVESAADAALITDAQEISTAFPTHFGVAHPDEVPVGVASDVPELAPAEAELEPAPEMAAAAAEEPALHVAEPMPFAVVSGEPEPEPELAPAPEPAAEAPAVADIPVEPAPAPMVEAAAPAGDESVAEELARALGHAMPPAAPVALADLEVPAAQPAPAAEAATEAVAPAGKAEIEAAVAAAVETVLERMKPTLYAAIMRELKG
jgi:CheY-like chemotaxis protein